MVGSQLCLSPVGSRSLTLAVAGGREGVAAEKLIAVICQCCAGQMDPSIQSPKEMQHSGCGS